MALLALAWGSRFAVEPFPDRDWPTWASRLEQKIETGSPESLSIPMNPPWSPLQFDVLIMAKEVRVPPAVIVAGLGTHGAVRQRFLSHCDRLAAIEVHLTAAAPSTTGAVRLTLIGSDDAVVRQREISRADMPLDGSWQRFRFDPIVGSAEQRYTIVVSAVQNAVEATVFVQARAAIRTPTATPSSSIARSMRT